MGRGSGCFLEPGVYLVQGVVHYSRQTTQVNTRTHDKPPKSSRKLTAKHPRHRAMSRQIKLPGTNSHRAKWLLREERRCAKPNRRPRKSQVDQQYSKRRLRAKVTLPRRACRPSTLRPRACPGLWYPQPPRQLPASAVMTRRRRRWQGIPNRSLLQLALNEAGGPRGVLSQVNHPIGELS